MGQSQDSGCHSSVSTWGILTQLVCSGPTQRTTVIITLEIKPKTAQWPWNEPQQEVKEWRTDARYTTLLSINFMNLCLRPFCLLVLFDWEVALTLRDLNCFYIVGGLKGQHLSAGQQWKDGAKHSQECQQRRETWLQVFLLTYFFTCCIVFTLLIIIRNNFTERKSCARFSVSESNCWVVDVLLILKGSKIV